MNARTAIAAAIVLVSLAACSTWVSLGELPLDTSTDGSADGGAFDRDADADTDAKRPAYDPCAGKACGAPCSVCDPSDRSCLETADLKACDTTGLCRNAAASCVDGSAPPYDPCEGKTCGSSCSECPPGDPTCNETAVVKNCNKARKCVAAGAPDC